MGLELDMTERLSAAQHRLMGPCIPPSKSHRKLWGGKFQMKGEAVMGRDGPVVSGRDRERWQWRRGFRSLGEEQR